MVQNKAEHCLLGLALSLVGLAGVYFNFFQLKPFCYVLVAIGLFWATFLGHLPFFMFPLLWPILLSFFSFLFPFYLIRFFILNPVRIKKNRPFCCIEWISFLTNWADPIVAYCAFENTIIFVTDPDDSDGLVTFVAYRSQRVIKKAKAKLKAFDIPEVIIDLQHVGKALEDISKSYPKIKETFGTKVTSSDLYNFFDKYMDSIQNIYESHPDSIHTLLAWYQNQIYIECEWEPSTYLGKIYYD